MSRVLRQYYIVLPSACRLQSEMFSDLVHEGLKTTITKGLCKELEVRQSLRSFGIPVLIVHWQARGRSQRLSRRPIKFSAVGVECRFLHSACVASLKSECPEVLIRASSGMSWQRSSGSFTTASLRRPSIACWLGLHTVFHAITILSISNKCFFTIYIKAADNETPQCLRDCSFFGESYVASHG